jgi:hypothetical protein
MPMPRLSTIVLTSVGILFVLLITGLVASSLIRPSLEEYAPSSLSPQEVGEGAVGPLLYTVDATAHDRWIYFDFSRGSVVNVSSRYSQDWDIAFRRHRMVTNGGSTNPAARAGVADLGPANIDSALALPEEGYVTDQQRGDAPRNHLLEDWYDYSWISHVLRPADRSYALRTADGKYAVLRFVGYYCPGGRPGCVTFRYRYRGDGVRIFPPASAALEQSPATKDPNSTG